VGGGFRSTQDLCATVGEDLVSAASAATVRLISRGNGGVIEEVVKLSSPVVPRPWSRLDGDLMP
jgi:hypothetical protein